MNEKKAFIEMKTERKATVAKNLRVIRKAIGMTQQALLETTGYTRATISKIESGIGDPRLSTITTLAAALGVSPLLLLITKEELLSLSAVHSHLKSLPAIPDEIAVELELLSTSKLTRKVIENTIQLAIQYLKPEVNSEMAGIAVGTAHRPGEGSKIGQALGKALEPH